jgi:hypothetical protein
MKILIIFCFTLFCLVASYGQATSNAKQLPILRQLQKQDVTGGLIQINENKQVDDLLNKCIDYNVSTINKGNVPGFRIRIFSQNNLDGGGKHAAEARSNFIKTFQEIEPGVVNIMYEQPNWKVYVGYFRTYTEALRVKKQIDYLYPEAFIKVELNIDYKKFSKSGN